MQIETIVYPYVYTDTGQRYHVSEFPVTPKVGAMIDENLNVIGNANDSECVSGVCPVK